MKTIRLLIAFFILAALDACTVIGTYYPATDNPEQRIFDSRMLGRWTPPKDFGNGFFGVDTMPGTMGKTYLIQFANPDKEDTDTLKMAAQLFEVNHFKYLDIWALVSDKLEDLVVPRHLFFRLLDVDETQLRIVLFDADELVRLINHKKIRLQNLRMRVDLDNSSQYSSYNYLIVDSTPVLRKVFDLVPSYPLLLEDTIPFVRAKGDTAAIFRK